MFEEIKYKRIIKKSYIQTVFCFDLSYFELYFVYNWINVRHESRIKLNPSFFISKLQLDG